MPVYDKNALTLGSDLLPLQSRSSLLDSNFDSIPFPLLHCHAIHNINTTLHSTLDSGSVLRHLLSCLRHLQQVIGGSQENTESNTRNWLPEYAATRLPSGTHTFSLQRCIPTSRRKSRTGIGHECMKISRPCSMSAPRVEELSP